MSDSNSYRQILRSSSIMGSAQAISYLVGLVRVKIVALILEIYDKKAGGIQSFASWD